MVRLLRSDGSPLYIEGDSANEGCAFKGMNVQGLPAAKSIDRRYRDRTRLLLVGRKGQFARADVHAPPRRNRMLTPLILRPGVTEMLLNLLIAQSGVGRRALIATAALDG